MHVEDLKWFRENVALPRMQQLMQNTKIPEGYCCITSLDISILDGRSCGVDSELTAKGLQYRDGRVEPYSYHTLVFDSEGFYDIHRNFVFLADGDLNIQDELQQMHLKTVLGNLVICADLFPELQQAKELMVESQPLEFLKMQYLMKDAEKPGLDTKIQTAQSLVDEASFRQVTPLKDHELV